MAEKNPTIAEQLEKLQLEEALESAQKRAGKRAARDARQKDIALSLADYEHSQAAIQAACRHKKGGKGVANLLNGSDSNCAIVKHTFASGIRCVACIRCRKYVEEPRPLPRGASAEQRKVFREQMQLFTEWWALPT